MATFEGRVTASFLAGDAEIAIENEALKIKGAGKHFCLDFADIKDMRLINYHIFLSTDFPSDPQVEIYYLGKNTEEFFDKLWDAYDMRSRQALFLEGKPLMECEGDYEYLEPDYSNKSKAKVALYEDSLVILPHDAGARRIPFCFCSSVVRDGFWLSLMLDTGEIYRIGRLGKDTDPFFEKAMSGYKRTLDSWTKAHQKLEKDYESRLGDSSERYNALNNSSSHLVKGLFSTNEDEGFWCIAIGNGKACMELFTKESTAAYIYQFEKGKEGLFVAAARHAIEAVGTHRELIFLEEDAFMQNSLYRMAAERNRYVKFLRNALADRIVHTGAWKERILKSL